MIPIPFAWPRPLQLPAPKPPAAVHRVVKARRAVEGVPRLFWTCSSLRQLWIRNGGNPRYANIAAAEGYAEARGYAYGPAATDEDKNGEGVDEGIWQINTKFWPGLATYNANGNARAAIIISHDGTDWSAWVSYQRGYYHGKCGYP